MLLRFRQDVVDLKPKVVVILAGTNDIAGNTGPMTDEEIQGNLASMARARAKRTASASCSRASPGERLSHGAERRATDHRRGR